MTCFRNFILIFWLALVLSVPAMANQELVEIEDIDVKETSENQIELDLSIKNLSDQDISALEVYIREGDQALGENFIPVSGQGKPIDIKKDEGAKIKLVIEICEGAEDGVHKLTLVLKLDGKELERDIEISIKATSSTEETEKPGQTTEKPTDLGQGQTTEKPVDPRKKPDQVDHPTPSPVVQQSPMGMEDMSPRPAMPTVLPMTDMGGRGGEGDFVPLSTSSLDYGAEGEVHVKNKPKIIIDRYTVNPDHPFAGESFSLYLRFYNTNQEKQVRNIKVTLGSTDTPASAISMAEGQATSPEGSIFTPVESSNTFYIPNIYAGGVAEKNIALSTARTLAAKNYMLTTYIEYEDMDGNEYRAEEIIGIPIIQESRLETAEVVIPDIGYLDQPVDGNIEFYNTGKDVLYNLRVNLEGEGFSSDYKQYYVGNMASGQSDQFRIDLVPTSLGKTQGKIVFSYEDSAGGEHEIVKDFSFETQDGMMMEGEMMVGPDGQPIDPTVEQGGGFFSLGPILLIVLLALILGGVIFWRKRSKKSQEESLKIDED